MTDNEIIKAWKEEIHLAEYVDSLYCNNVELTLIMATLDLINRLKAELERLSKQVELGNEYIESLTKAFNDRTAELQTAKLDIKQLHTDVERIENRRIKDCRSWQSKYSSLRAEAVKEFAERLNNYAFEAEANDDPQLKVRLLFADDIEKAKKEMVGEG